MSQPSRQPLSILRPLEIPGVAVFTLGAGDLPMLAITTPHAEAHIYLHGAHLTHYQPAGRPPVIFLSQQSAFAPGKAIRGGVPLIFPWFGPREGHPESPAHGFARTATWEVESLTLDGDDTVTAIFRLTANPQTRALWRHDFVLRQNIRISRRLVMTLEVENTSSEPFVFEEALHTYFTVGDVRQTFTTGLENTTYFDKADGMTTRTQPAEAIRITGETDRIYPGSRAACVLEDRALNRKITVEKIGSATTVVWNPWIAKAAAFLDFGDSEWTKMLCIETANAGADKITLAPGKKHAMRAIITGG